MPFFFNYIHEHEIFEAGDRSCQVQQNMSISGNKKLFLGCYREAYSFLATSFRISFSTNNTKYIYIFFPEVVPQCFHLTRFPVTHLYFLGNWPVAQYAMDTRRAIEYQSTLTSRIAPEIFIGLDVT